MSYRPMRRFLITTLVIALAGCQTAGGSVGQAPGSVDGVPGRVIDDIHPGGSTTPAGSPSGPSGTWWPFSLWDGGITDGGPEPDPSEADLGGPLYW